MTQNTVVNVEALQRLVERHPDEFRKLLGEVRAESEVVMHDRFGRTISKTDKVITPNHEQGTVMRLDRGSGRVLIKLDDGGTRMLKARRIEVARGRPRKNSLRMATA